MARVDDAVAISKSHKQWTSATIESLSITKERTEQVKVSLAAMEQKEADKLAAEVAERLRQEEKLRQEELRRKREAEMAAAEAYRQEQAAQLAQHNATLKASKAEEAAEVKASTVRFKKAAQAEKETQDLKVLTADMKFASKQVQAAVFACQKTCSMMCSALMVCQNRLHMREQRPQPECFKDHVDFALEKEMKQLDTSRRELQAFAKSGQEVASALEQVQTLLCTSQSRVNVFHRMEKSSSLPILKKTQEAIPRFEELAKKARAVVEEAHAISAKIQDVAPKSELACNKANAAVLASFERKRIEVEGLRKVLEQQKGEAQLFILAAEQRLAGLQARSLASPETPRRAEATQAQIESTRTKVAGLKELCQRLDDDYQGKSAVLKIDTSCRTLTRVRACGNTAVALKKD